MQFVMKMFGNTSGFLSNL